MLKSDSTLENEKVVGRFMALERIIVGSFDETPNLNSIACDLEFSDLQVKERADKSTAENMLTRVDPEAFSLMLMDSISN